VAIGVSVGILGISLLLIGLPVSRLVGGPLELSVVIIYLGYLALVAVTVGLIARYRWRAGWALATALCSWASA